MDSFPFENKLKNVRPPFTIEIRNRPLAFRPAVLLLNRDCFSEDCILNNQIIEIHSADEINERVKKLAAEISNSYQDRDITILSVLEDSFVFLADLLRAIKTPLRTSFVRYDHRAHGGIQDLNFSTPIEVTGRDVMLVEGVLSTGVPQQYLIQQLESHGATSVKLCVLIDKPEQRRTSVQPEWRAFESMDEYVFGYGLGLQERWRGLPYLATYQPTSGASS